MLLHMLVVYLFLNDVLTDSNSIATYISTQNPTPAVLEPSITGQAGSARTVVAAPAITQSARANKAPAIHHVLRLSALEFDMEYQQQSTSSRRSGVDKTVYAGKTVYASFGKGVSSKCCSFKLEQEQQCFEGVQPQVRACFGNDLGPFRQRVSAAVLLAGSFWCRFAAINLCFGMHGTLQHLLYMLMHNHLLF